MLNFNLKIRYNFHYRLNFNITPELFYHGNLDAKIKNSKVEKKKSN